MASLSLSFGWNGDGARWSESSVRLRRGEHGACAAQRRQEGGEPGAAERHIGLRRLTAQALDDLHRVMADAVDGEEHDARLADETGELGTAILDAAVVMQQLRREARRDLPQADDMAGLAPDIEHRPALQGAWRFASNRRGSRGLIHQDGFGCIELGP